MCKTIKTKTVTCQDCDKSRQIRADSTAQLCGSCARRRASKPGEPRPNRIRGCWMECVSCGGPFWYRPSQVGQRFCSAACANKSKRKGNRAEKMRARLAANNALRDGKIDRMPCASCGLYGEEMHHEDYAKPLDVIWYCRKCHTRLHVQRGDLKAHVEDTPGRHTPGSKPRSKAMAGYSTR